MRRGRASRRIDVCAIHCSETIKVLVREPCSRYFSVLNHNYSMAIYFVSFPVADCCPFHQLRRDRASSFDHIHLELSFRILLRPISNFQRFRYTEPSIARNFSSELRSRGIATSYTVAREDYSNAC